MWESRTLPILFFPSTFYVEGFFLPFFTHKHSRIVSRGVCVLALRHILELSNECLNLDFDFNLYFYSILLRINRGRAKQFLLWCTQAHNLLKL